MKLAIEISGHLRTFRQCAPLLKPLLFDINDCDVFVHTWQMTDHENLSWHGKTGTGEGSPAEPITDDIIREVKALYQAKMLVVEDEKSLPVINGYFMPPRPNKNGFLLQAVYNTLYTEARAHQIMRQYEKDNNVRYDFVVRLRPDVALLEPFFSDIYLSYFAMAPDTAIFFPRNIGLNSRVVRNDKPYIISYALPSMCDILYMASPSAMDKMMEIVLVKEHFEHFFVQLPKLWQQQTSMLGMTLGIELIFHWYAQRRGVMCHDAEFTKILKRYDNQNDVATLFALRLDNCITTDFFDPALIKKNLGKG